jgi:hypothetical protein
MKTHLAIMMGLCFIYACKKDTAEIPETPPPPQNTSLFGSWDQIAFSVIMYPPSGDPITNASNNVSAGELRYVFASDSTYLRTSDNSLYPRDSGAFFIQNNVLYFTGDSVQEIPQGGFSGVANDRFSLRVFSREPYTLNDPQFMGDSMDVFRTLTFQRL